MTGEASQDTLAAWRAWRAAGQRWVAPALVHFEVANALHKYTRSGLLSTEAVDRTMALLLQLPITAVDDDDLHRRALAAARRYDIASVYDAHYLALAERMGIELVTADAAMHRRVTEAAPWVRLLE